MLILICLLFCGCTGATSADYDRTVGTAESKESEEPKEEVSDIKTFQTEMPQGAKIEKLSSYQNLILITYSLEQKYTAAMFDTDNHSVREILCTGDPVEASFLKNGDYYILNSSNREMTVYAHKDNSVRDTYKMSENGIPNQNGEGIWDAQSTAVSDRNGNHNTFINHIRYEQGKTEKNGKRINAEQNMPDAVFKLIYADGPYLYYRYARAGYYERRTAEDYSSTICRLNWETSVTEQYEEWVKGTDQPYGHKSELYHSELLIPWEDPGSLYTVEGTDIIDADGSVLLLENANSLQAADAATSRMLLEIPFPSISDKQISETISREGHFVAVSEGPFMTVYRWTGEGSPVSYVKSSRIDHLDSRIQDETKEVLDRRGITVTDEKMVDEAYQPQPLTSKLRKYAALLELNTVLGYFPEHMTEEMKPEGIDIFPVCLTGDMTTSGLSSVFSADGKFYMAFNVNLAYDDTSDLIPAKRKSSLGQTIIHEMMHIMGSRLSTFEVGGKSIMSFWDSMVPPADTENAYQNSYDEEWTDSYTLNDPAAGKEDIWFEDAYARTMPEEDRAELFKSLFLGVHSNGESWNTDYPHLLKKGQLLCAMIRSAFPSVQAAPAGSVYWERNFKQISLDAFEESK